MEPQEGELYRLLRKAAHYSSIFGVAYLGLSEAMAPKNQGFIFFPIFFPYNRGEEDFDGLCLLLRSSSSETGWCLRPLAHLPSLQVPIDQFPRGLPNSRMVYGIYGP